MNKTIGVLAHVDAGKTTFGEQLLYHTKSIRERGRVDHKDAFLDDHNIEKDRGITVFSGQGIMEYNNSKYYLIDTPGHTDFSPEMERSIQIMDYAIIIVSAVEGIQGHTETVWHLLRKHSIPTFFFINKIDRVGADVNKVISEIKLNFTEDICNITKSFSNGEIEDELIEFLAERNEALFEKFIEEKYDKTLWISKFKSMIKESKIFPYASGSALQDIGIKDFIIKLDELTFTNYSQLNKKDFAGRVYKIRYDENGTRISHIKALRGNLKVRDEIGYGNDDNRKIEKVTQLRIYNGNKYRSIDEVEAGELFAVTGLSNVGIGDGLGSLKEKSKFDLVPTLKSKVIFESEISIKDMLKAFNILNAEDPSLNVTWIPSLQEIHISVMGIIQLEVLKRLVKDRFGFHVSFDEPEILYKETIEDIICGYGHFEPLGHYAEVHLKLEPGERDSGIEFKNACHADNLTVGNQRLVKHHIFEKKHKGLLTGSEVTDLKITLLTGKAHNKHTSGGDFREATYRALRQALEKAKNILLEPYYNFKIKVDLDYIGRVISDIQNSHGSFESPKTLGDKAIIIGKAPVSTFMNYSSDLSSFTQGRGIINMTFGGYQKCHNKIDVIERIGYNKNVDPEYTSSSIFCSKGKSYTLPWDKVEDQAHCLIINNC